QVAVEVLPHRHQVRQQLAGVKHIGEAVDYRNRRLARHFDAGRMSKRANHDEIDPTRKIARDVLDRFTFADTDILRREIDGVAAQLRHASFEAETRPQRRLLKDHRERAATQVRMLEAGLQLALQSRSERQQSVQLGWRLRTQIDEITL